MTTAGTILLVSVLSIAATMCECSLERMERAAKPVHAHAVVDNVVVARDSEILNALCRIWPTYPKSNLRLAVTAACDERYTATKDQK